MENNLDFYIIICINLVLIWREREKKGPGPHVKRNGRNKPSYHLSGHKRKVNES